MSRGLPSLRHLLADVRDATARELRLVRLRERLTLLLRVIGSLLRVCAAAHAESAAVAARKTAAPDACSCPAYQCLLCLFARANLAGEPDPTTRIRI
uniref:Uncharacterized protein n=1 Tax=Trichogramma kaykai TaxID=54128 RepID=A0ABD2WW85_9HYME